MLLLDLKCQMITNSHMLMSIDEAWKWLLSRSYSNFSSARVETQSCGPNQRLALFLWLCLEDHNRGASKQKCPNTAKYKQCAQTHKAIFRHGFGCI